MGMGAVDITLKGHAMLQTGNASQFLTSTPLHRHSEAVVTS